MTSSLRDSSVGSVKTTYLKDAPQCRPISTQKIFMLDDRYSCESTKLPQYVNEILNRLSVASTQVYYDQERNSNFLRDLIATHVKIQSVGYVAWVHTADRYIQATHLYDPNATPTQNLGKRYFYDAALHQNQKTDTAARKYMKDEQKLFSERMQKVFQEHAPQKNESSSEEENDSWIDRCWTFLQTNWESFLKYLARVVFDLYEESQESLEKS